MADQVMSINDLILPDKAKKFFTKQWGINALHPTQAQSMEDIFSGMESASRHHQETNER